MLNGRLILAILPRLFRLKLQGRLLLLCLGAALPIATVFALSLFNQFHYNQVQIKQLARTETFALSKSIEIWAQKQYSDIYNFEVQPIGDGSEPIPINGLQWKLLKQHPEWQEVFRLYTDGWLISYKPAKDYFFKAPYSAKKVLATKFNGSKASFYGFSPLSGRKRYILLHRCADNSIMAAAFNPDTLSQFVTTNMQIVRSVSGSASTLFDIAIADSQKDIITLTDDIKSAKEKDINNGSAICQLAVPSLGIYISPVFASSAQETSFSALTQIIFLAVIALLGSSYLAFISTKHLSRQIKLLVKEVLALGHGDFTKRLQVNGNDELGKLAKAFNKIASKMQLEHDHRLLEEKISLAIRQSLDLDQVLLATVTELGKALSASRVCLALVETPNQNETPARQKLDLLFDYVWCDESKNGTQLNNRSLRLENNKVFNMIIEQGSILSMDALDENGPTPLFPAGTIAPDDWKCIRSLIACPITAAEGTIGLILIQQCDRERVWTDKELELVEVVTRQLTVAMQHAHLYNYTRTMAEQEMLVNQIVRCVRGSLDLDTILNTVTRELCTALNADRCQILQPNANGPLIVSHEYHKEGLADTKSLNLYSQQLDFSPSNSEAIFRQGNFLLGIDLQKLSMHGQDADLGEINKTQVYDPWAVSVINDTQADDRASSFEYFIDNSNSKSLIAAPLLSGSRIIGLLVVHQCESTRAWRNAETQLVCAVADQLALAVTQAHLFAQVKYQAITDGLTGLYNHVYFKNRLNEELRLADRKGLPCSLLMLDLDHLKNINDTYGHPVGDAAIRSVATTLKTLLRSGDTAARYGGEEFAVILPETSLLEAALIGDRLCTNISNVKVSGMPQITVSVGAASYPRQAKDPSELITKADQALYEAKKSGRNQIWISESISETLVKSRTIVPEFRVTRRLAVANGRKEEDNRSSNVYRKTKAE